MTTVNLWNQLGPQYVRPHAEKEVQDALLPQDTEIILWDPNGENTGTLNGSVDSFFNTLRDRDYLAYDSSKGINENGLFFRDKDSETQNQEGLTTRGLSYTLGTSQTIAEKIAKGSDADGDGFTQAGELEGIFKAMDPNQDGSVDADERATYLKQFEATA